jgi:hypothetical protein
LKLIESDNIIVTEKRENIAHVKQFIVRPNLLYDGLIWLMSSNNCFQCVEYMFYLLSKLEYDKIKSCINICSSRLKTFGNARVNDLHVYMKCLRGYASYWNTAKSDLLAMIRQLGAPTWFITLSANDINWDDMMKNLLYAQHLSDNNIKNVPFIFDDNKAKNMTYKERAQLLNDHPVVAARHFDRRFRKLMLFLMTDNSVLGNLPK